MARHRADVCFAAVVARLDPSRVVVAEVERFVFRFPDVLRHSPPCRAELEASLIQLRNGCVAGRTSDTELAREVGHRVRRRHRAGGAQTQRSEEKDASHIELLRPPRPRTRPTTGALRAEGSIRNDRAACDLFHILRYFSRRRRISVASTPDSGFQGRIRAAHGMSVSDVCPNEANLPLNPCGSFTGVRAASIALLSRGSHSRDQRLRGVALRRIKNWASSEDAEFRSGLRFAGKRTHVRTMRGVVVVELLLGAHVFPLVFHAHDGVRRCGNLIARRAGKPPGQEYFELLSIDHGRPHFWSIRAKRPATTIANPLIPMTTPTGSMIIVTPRPRPRIISTSPTITAAACSKKPRIPRNATVCVMASSQRDLRANRVPGFLPDCRLPINEAASAGERSVGRDISVRSQGPARAGQAPRTAKRDVLGDSHAATEQVDFQLTGIQRHRDEPPPQAWCRVFFGVLA